MKIEIYKNEKRIKSKKVNLNLDRFKLNIDFKSINRLQGNKIILENVFQIQKSESITNG
jgi:hypothetical protein